MMEKFHPPIRCEGTVIPEGISHNPLYSRSRIYIRQGNTIGIITLPRPGWDFEACPWAMHWTVRSREEDFLDG